MTVDKFNGNNKIINDSFCIMFSNAFAFMSAYSKLTNLFITADRMH